MYINRKRALTKAVNLAKRDALVVAGAGAHSAVEGLGLSVGAVGARVSSGGPAASSAGLLLGAASGQLPAPSGQLPQQFGPSSVVASQMMRQGFGDSQGTASQGIAAAAQAAAAAAHSYSQVRLLSNTP